MPEETSAREGRTAIAAFVRTAAITGAAFGTPLGLLAGVAAGAFLGSSAGVRIGLLAVPALGVPFGLMVAGFLAVQRRRSAGARAELAGERLVHDGPANHFLNGEGVGGWLYLTDARLLFRSHAFNLQPHELSIPLAEIAAVEAVKTARIVPNGLRVVTRSGDDERFVVTGNRRWCAAIEGARAAA